MTHPVQPAGAPQACAGSRSISALLWMAIAVMTILWLPTLFIVFAVTAPFDRGRYAAGRWFRLAAVTAVKLVPYWTFRTSGVRITDPRRPYVAVGNHESYADIFLISHLPWEMKWLSKAEILNLPIMGWMMRMAGDIGVHRGSQRSRRESMEQIRDRLAKNVSVMIMPEGTRSPTEELLPFRDGAFRVAVETGTPILPIVVAGTRHAMAKGSLVFNRATAEARVLEPIETAGMTADDVPALRDRVRDLIDSTRREMQRELAETTVARPR